MQNLILIPNIMLKLEIYNRFFPTMVTICRSAHDKKNNFSLSLYKQENDPIHKSLSTSAKMPPLLSLSVSQKKESISPSLYLYRQKK